MAFWDSVLSFFGLAEDLPVNTDLEQMKTNPPPKPPGINTKVLPPHGGQVSRDNHFRDTVNTLGKGLSIVKPPFVLSIIPLIRTLTRTNPNMGQAFFDVVSLANTGHLITFDSGVPSDQQDKMRQELETAALGWGDGMAGINGLVNRKFAQLLIGGALSSEWVVSNNFDNGISNNVLINPEDVRWVYDESVKRYLPYQALNNQYLIDKALVNGNMIKLNPYSFKYFAGVGPDEDIPYGIPPYMNALESLATQRKMVGNVEFISDLLGILGFLSATMDKPDIRDGESEADYVARLNLTLLQLKDRIEQGQRNGVSVGFKGDHEFDFKSTTKDAGGMKDLWQNNETQVSSGLKYDTAFMGRSYGGSESLITILFTKMLSQLTNLQQTLQYDLEFGYALHLRLRGFTFSTLKVEFNSSTITDELKYQQAQEIKIRNNRIMYADGVISLLTYANDVGFPKPDQEEPRVPIDPNGVMVAQQQAEARAAAKDASQRKSTDKSKPQGTIRKSPNPKTRSNGQTH